MRDAPAAHNLLDPALKVPTLGALWRPALKEVRQQRRRCVVTWRQRRALRDVVPPAAFELIERLVSAALTAPQDVSRRGETRPRRFVRRDLCPRPSRRRFSYCELRAQLHNFIHFSITKI
jgi:hypothetical protein